MAKARKRYPITTEKYDFMTRLMDALKFDMTSKLMDFDDEMKEEFAERIKFIDDLMDIGFYEESDREQLKYEREEWLTVMEQRGTKKKLEHYLKLRDPHI